MPNTSPINIASSIAPSSIEAVDAHPCANVDIQNLSQRFKACGDPLRLQILQVLKSDTFGVLELAQLFETKQSGMSHHLKVLSNAGLVEAQREGNAIFYRRPFNQIEVANQLTTSQLFLLVDSAPLPAELDQRIEKIREQRAVQSQAFFDKSSERFSEQQEMICDYSQYAEASYELLEKSGLGRDNVILELGSGEGQFLKPLSLNHKQVIALDTSETLLQKAQKFTRSEGLSNIEFVVGDTSTFRAQETVVDAVIMNMVLHHVPAPSKIFEDCYSFLSNGGVMVVCDLSHHHQDWAKDRCGDLWLGFEPQELTSWAQRVGFEEDESVFIGLRNGFQIQLRKFVKPLLSKATQ